MEIYCIIIRVCIPNIFIYLYRILCKRKKNKLITLIDALFISRISIYIFFAKPFCLLNITNFVFAEFVGGHRFSYAEMFQASTNNLLRWKCKACSKEVTNKWHHFYSHTTQRSFCPYCPATYSRIDTLRTHLKSKHQSCMRMKNF